MMSTWELTLTIEVLNHRNYDIHSFQDDVDEGYHDQDIGHDTLNDVGQENDDENVIQVPLIDLSHGWLSQATIQRFGTLELWQIMSKIFGSFQNFGHNMGGFGNNECSAFYVIHISI